MNEWRYAFREFSVPGDRNNVGGILGIDPSSWDRTLGDRPHKERSDSGPSGTEGEVAKKGDDTKVRILKKEDLDKEREAQREAAVAAASASAVVEMEIPKGPRKTTTAGS